MGCVGCVALPIVAIVFFAGTVGGGLFFFTRQPLQVVHGQLAEIRAGKLDDAYARLSDDYKARLTRAEFTALVEVHAALRDNADASFSNISRSPGRLHLEGTLRSRSGAKEAVEYDLRRSGREWKITAMAFP